MTDPIIFRISRVESDRLYQAAVDQDAAALTFWQTMWKDHQDQQIACFICDEEPLPYPPHVMLLPDYENPILYFMVVPVCDPCKMLPAAVRVSRSFKILKKMHKAKTGKNLEFRRMQLR